MTNLTEIKRTRNPHDLSSSGLTITEARSLSPRKVMLLQLLSDGYTLGEAAKKMGIVRGTAKNMVMMIKDYFGADTTLQAVAMGIRRGVIV